MTALDCLEATPVVDRPVHIGESIRRLLLQLLTPDELRHIAAIAEADKWGLDIRSRLSDEALEDLADILVRTGSRETVGWWKANLGT
jgi:hypothetical protein